MYLEEQKENAGESKSIGVQADKFAPRRKPKPFVPPKRGFDCGVQVDSKYIFNFDRNVKPIVEVVVQKSLEQALIETQHEEVQKSLQRAEEEFQHKQERRKQELQERILAEKKLVRAKEERKREAKKVHEQIKAEQKQKEKRIAAEPPKEEKDSLDAEHVVETISNQVLSHLCKKVADQIQMGKFAAQLANDIIKTAIRRHAEKIQDAKNELQNFRIRLQIFGESEEIGPIVLGREATIGDLAESVSKWYDSTLSLEEIKLYSGQRLLDFSVPVKEVANSALVVKIEHAVEEEEEEKVVVEEANEPTEVPE